MNSKRRMVSIRLPIKLIKDARRVADEYYITVSSMIEVGLKKMIEAVKKTDMNNVEEYFDG